MKEVDFSLIIPCYQDASHLEKNSWYLVDLLNSVKFSYEIIFVEDCSQDNTKECLQKISTKFQEKNISHKILYNPQNSGRGYSVKKGLLNAHGKISGFIDIDLENKPEAILPMYVEINSGRSDLVVGNRIKSYYRFNFIRRITHLAYKYLIQLFFNLPIHDTETGLKLFNTQKILPLLTHSANDHWFWDTEIILVANIFGLRINEIPVVFTKDENKKSTVHVLQDSFLYIAALANFSWKKNKISQRIKTNIVD